MLQEIYLRDSSDPFFSSTTLQHSDRIECLLGQIKMLLFTKKGSVLGFFDYGIDLEDLIFTLNLDTSVLESRINTAIQQFCPAAIDFDVSVVAEFYQGTVRDVCMINIIIEGVKLYGILIK